MIQFGLLVYINVLLAVLFLDGKYFIASQNDMVCACPQLLVFFS